MSGGASPLVFREFPVSKLPKCCLRELLLPSINRCRKTESPGRFQYQCHRILLALVILACVPAARSVSCADNAGKAQTTGSSSTTDTRDTSTAALTDQEVSGRIEVLNDEGTRALHAIYDYDRTIPLESRIVEKVEKDGTIREKIVFRGVQGFLVPGYLEYSLPSSEPRPCVLLLHGWSGSKEHFWKDGGYISGGNVRTALLSAGFAVLALDAQCHGDRISENDFAPVNHYLEPAVVNEHAAVKDAAVESHQRKGYFSQQEIYIQTTRDYRRALDYLQTRAEIDFKKIGLVGYSMGGAQAFLLTGVDSRIQTAVACCPPAENSKWSPIAPQNFAVAIGQRPFLMIMGRTDTMCPVEKAQALHDLIPARSKQLLFLDAGHRLPPDYVSHAVEWVSRYFQDSAESDI